MTTLKFDYEQIVLAKEQLGITKSVRIRLTHYRRENIVAWYQNIGGQHFISLTNQSKNINASLWHELAHAAQAERMNPEDDFYEMYRSFDGTGLNYLNNELEVEARRIAEENSHKILVRN